MAIVAPSLVVIVVSNRLVAMSRRSVVMHCRSGLVHVTVCIEAIVLVAVSTRVGHEYLRTVIVEMAPVVVRIHCKRPSACFPCHGAIEVCQSDVLVVLPGVQHIAEVCIATIPPDTEDISVSVQASIW